MKFETRAIDVSRIYLDNENPRHDPIDSEAEIIGHLVAREGVKQLARHISEIGSTSPLERIGVVRHHKVYAAAYYRGAPVDLRPMPIRLTRGDVPTRLKKFADVRAAYQEPSDDRLAGINHLPNNDRIELWLRQFDSDDHIECALTLLDQFRMLKRDDTVSALRSFFERHGEFRGAVVVPLGDVKDSGGIQAYFSADLLGTYVSECLSLEQAASTGRGRPIVFVDDFVGSGGQIRTMFAAGFKRPDLVDKDLGEKRSAFGSEIRDYLLQHKVAFVFTAGWDSGLANVVRLAEELGMNSTVSCYLGEKDIPFAFDGCLETFEPEIQESFRDRCREIGKALMAASVKEVVQAGGNAPSAETLSQRELGYGNRAMLLATPFNVPTQSLTAIWATGQVDDLTWVPLMARRKKT